MIQDHGTCLTPVKFLAIVCHTQKLRFSDKFEILIGINVGQIFGYWASLDFRPHLEMAIRGQEVGSLHVDKS